VIPPNRLDPPIAQESTAFCASFSLRIDIPNTDHDIDSCGLQRIGCSLQQIDARVDIAYDP
jgi:hypothetical protein